MIVVAGAIRQASEISTGIHLNQPISAQIWVGLSRVHVSRADIPPGSFDGMNPKPNRRSRQRKVGCIANRTETNLFFSRSKQIGVERESRLIVSHARIGRVAGPNQGGFPSRPKGLPT
jgi:hypothetical protein